MTEENSVSNDPNRRRRRRRRKRGSSSGENGQNQNGQRNQSGGGRGRRDGGGSGRGRGGHSQQAYDGSVIPLTSFDLFCAYWLGIGDNNTYRKPNIRDVSRRFDRSTQEVEEALKFCAMDAESVKKSGFEMSLAQLDISVAPEGIDKRELAKGIYEEFLEVNPDFKEWIEPEPETQDDDSDDVDGDDVDASEEE